MLLTLIKERAKKIGNTKLANDIYNKYLVNSHEEGDNFFKLMPKELDKEDYKNLINNPDDINKTMESRIIDAYNYFDKKMKENNFEDEGKLDKLKEIITNNLGITIQELDENDDPLQVFDSINGKRKNVSKVDLICNYLFEHIPEKDQINTHSELWVPLQQTFEEEDLKRYIQDYLNMRKGLSISEADIYPTLRKIVSETSSIEILKDIHNFSVYYMKFIDPDNNEDDKEIKKMLNRLKRTDVTTIYPLLLKFYDCFSKKKIDRNNFVDILSIIESYIIRKDICDVSAKKNLRQIFSSFILLLDSEYSNNIVEGFKIFLQSKNYPKDEEFKAKLKEFSFPENNKISKLILESFEEFSGHKEMVSFNNLTVEHIVPDVLTDWWKEHLGNDYADIHKKCQNSIGNLTLIAKEYNSEASNGNFQLKKEIYKKSHVELNKYFDNLIKWDKEEIEKRADSMSETAVKIWTNPFLVTRLPTKKEESGIINKISSKIQGLVSTSRQVQSTISEEVKLQLSVKPYLEKHTEQYKIAEKELEVLINNSTKINSKSKIYLLPNNAVIIVRYSKYHNRPYDHCWFGIDRNTCKNYVNKYDKCYVIFKCQDVGIFPIPCDVLIDNFKDFKTNSNGVWSLHIRSKENKILIEMKMDISEYANRVDILENKR